jgi:hypothetical protein
MAILLTTLQPFSKKKRLQHKKTCPGTPPTRDLVVDATA